MKINESVECLNYAESLIIWSLRKISQCSVFCVSVEAEFVIAFGDNSFSSLVAFRDFAHELSRGSRPLKIGMLSNRFLTSDEASILSVLASVNSGNKDHIRAHALWIFGRSTKTEAFEKAVERLNNTLLKSGFPIRQMSFSKLNQCDITKPIILHTF